MENNNKSQEMSFFLNQIDFVIPIKQIGLITRSVLEAVSRIYAPRVIYIITPEAEISLLKSLLPDWGLDMKGIKPLAEEEFFKPTLNLTLDNIIAEYDFTKEGNQREPGWWIQQLIKLGAATQIPEISSPYIVWDADLIPMRPWKLYDYDESKNPFYYFAVLQAESRSEFNTEQYKACMMALTGMVAKDPPEGGTFVTHHMVFRKERVLELFELMKNTTHSTLSWPLLIMSYSRSFYRFSEYKTYSTFMSYYHSDELHYYPLSMYGDGVRIREPEKFIEKMIETCDSSLGGIAYEEIFNYVNSLVKSGAFESERNDKKEGNNYIVPAYLQVEHVYGLSQFSKFTEKAKKQVVQDLITKI